jgi:hypothetical protein
MFNLHNNKLIYKISYKNKPLIFHLYNAKYKITNSILHLNQFNFYNNHNLNRIINV